MTNLRIALGIRNTHSIRQNFLYFLYEKYARLRSSISCSAEEMEFARQLDSTGIAIIGVVDVDELARIAEEKLNEVPVVDGYAQFPRRYNPLLVPHLYRILLQKKSAIEACLRSHFKVNWFEVQKIAPGRQSAGSSFEYHTDDTPLPLMKLFIYLTDARESNGAFRAFDYKHTDRLLRLGMLESTYPGERRAKAQGLIPPGFDESLTVVEGPKGTVFLFDNNLIHKGTLPREGIRIHISMEIMPSPSPITEADLLRGCESEIQEYYPVNPFRRKSAH